MCGGIVEFGFVELRWYGVMMALAFLSGVFHCTYLSRHIGKDRMLMSDLVFWTMIAGLVGARLASVFSNPSEYLREPSQILAFWRGGLVYYGGLAGAAAGLLVFARVRRERVLPLLDVVGVALPLAHAIGRVGCYLNGCCFGTLSSGALAVVYPPRSAVSVEHFNRGLIASDLLPSKAVHAVQLYEAGLNLLLYFGLLWFFFRRKSNGSVIALYAMFYGVIRLVTEVFRGDDRLALGPVTAAQLFSAALFLAGAGLWIRICRREDAKANSNG